MINIASGLWREGLFKKQTAKRLVKKVSVIFLTLALVFSNFVALTFSGNVIAIKYMKQKINNFKSFICCLVIITSIIIFNIFNGVLPKIPTAFGYGGGGGGFFVIINNITMVNPTTVAVTYSDAMGASALTEANYSFSGGLSVVDVFQEGSNTYRVIASADITPGTTTLTVSSSVLAADTTPNATTTAQVINAPVKVKISEMSAEMGSATSEFVELYNDGSAPVDISGWQLQSSAANPVSWTTIGTVPASTTIGAFGFYLFATTDFNTASATDGNTAMTAGLELAGGHIRLLNAGSSEADKIGWGTATSPEGTALAVTTAGKSYERKSFGDSQAVDLASGGMDVSMGNGWDTGNNSFDLVVQTSPNPQNASSTAEQPNFNDYQGAAASGPMINHAPLSKVFTGANLDITAQIGDPMTPVDQITTELHYMTGDGTPANNTTGQYTTVLGTHQANGYFKFTVPQVTIDASTANGLYYYLKVVTNGGTAFMSKNPAVDMGTYDTPTLKEVDIAKNPFTVTVAASSGTLRSITGTITNGVSNIESAMVYLEGTGYSTTTAADGTFTLSSIPEGIYNVVVIKNGYFDGFINDLFLQGGNKAIGTFVMTAGTGGGMTGDTTKPMVNWTAPNDGMFGVPPGQANFKIFVGFSKDLDSSTFTNSNVYLTTDGTTPIASTVTYDNVPADNASAGLPPDQYLGIINAPAGGLAAGTNYFLVINGAVRDTVGNTIQGNQSAGGHVISFATGSNFMGNGFNPDSAGAWSDFGKGAMMPPFVLGVNPNDGAMNIVPNIKANITFSDPMDSSSVTTAGNIKLYRITVVNNAEVTTLISSTTTLDTSQTIATVTPGAQLSAGKYRVVVSGALKSANGIWMGDPNQSQNTANYSFYKSHFEVGAGIAADSTAPTVSGSWPTANDTNIAVNPGVLTVQFSEAMAPSTINSSSVTLKRGSTVVNSTVSYDPMSYSASLTPNVVLATSTVYTLTVTTDATDVVGNAIASNYQITFTTSATGDTTAPTIQFANGDEYSIAITFSEAMNASKITDTANWGKSVLNPTNYVIKYGTPATVAASGTSINLSSAKFKYEEQSNTVIVENLGLNFQTVSGNDFYVDMREATVADGVADLSNNIINTSGATTQAPIKSSAVTMGNLGPSIGGFSSGGSFGPEMGDMGMMKAGVFPMNAMAGQTTVYFVDVPVTTAIQNGGKIVLTFPTGFDVSSAKKDTFSPVNNDINEWNAGTISFGTAVESSGGASNDGVTVDASTRVITVTLAVNGTPPANDFLHLDLAGIKNSSIARDFTTSGYSVDMKVKKADGSLSESVNGMPFFINAGGSATLSGSISGIQAADVDGTSDEVTVFLGSPMTGPMEATATIADDGTGSYSFTNLPTGQFMIFTDPVITLDGNDYEGNPMPQPITVASGANTKNLTLTKSGSGAVATITVTLTGDFSTSGTADNVDIFAGSPSGFRVKTVTPNTDDAAVGDDSADTVQGNNVTKYNIFLPAGTWMVGAGPAMPKGPMSSKPPMPDWMPPMPTQIVSDGSTPQTLSISISNASINVVGYVKDGSDNAIADAEVWAYQPMGTGGNMGAHTKTNTDGKFTLKIASVGTYSVGVFKPGLPNVPDKTIIVSANTGATDDNATADVKVDGALVTTDNKLIFVLQKSSTTISGKVTNGTDPVSYAPVWTSQNNGTGHAETMSDSSGNYILYVGNGSWNVQSYIPGYGDSEEKTVVVSGSSMTQNLAPTTGTTYYTIQGSVSLNDSAQTFMPIRAVKFNDNGSYAGKEYGAQTDSSGNYSISVPAGKYRVDIWTPEYGEVELTVTDEVANSPANVEITNASKTGKDITITSGNLNTITLAFTNGTSSQSAILDIDGVSGTPPKPTGFHKTIKLSSLSSSSTVKLKNGTYMLFMNVPGVGSFTPVSNPVTVSGNATVTFTLPVSASNMFAVSGNVSNEGNVKGAWVWIDNPTTGVHTGTTTDASGNYTLTVKSGTYKMGVEMPGYVTGAPISIVVDQAKPNTDFTITTASQFITGRIYADADSDNTYDSGEEIADGWVTIENTTGKQRSGAITDADGTFSIGAANGTYILRGIADGYSETKHTSTITVSGSGSSGNNLKLATNANWSGNQKSKSMTPASGGTLDDSLDSGSGVKIVVPPNAFGSDTSSGSLKAADVVVVATSSAEPLGEAGKEISAKNNSGQAINNLNDDIEIELNYYKDDVDDTGIVDLTDLKLLTNSYWDSSVNDWVPVSTTKKAYTKTSASDAEWTAQTDFDTFVDAIDANSDAYGDYKIALQSTSDHLTIFGATMPADSTAPSAPAGLSQTSGSGTSVVLDWTDNSEADLLEYEIYRSTSSGVTASNSNQVNTSTVSTSTFTDSTTTAWTSYYYTVTATDDSGNESVIATEVRMCSTKTVDNGTVGADCTITCNSGYAVSGNSCASSGGGGGYVPLPSTTTTTTSVTTTTTTTSDSATTTVTPETTMTTTAPAPSAPTMTDVAKAFAEKIKTIASEAADVFKVDIDSLLVKLKIKRDTKKEEAGLKYFIKIKAGIDNIDQKTQDTITNFLTYGTETTKVLGEGERAGVVNSFKSAFGKLPTSEKDWNDTIKIANGRWPEQRNEKKETEATKSFVKIYKRQPDRKNPNDDAAVTVMSYGLRPANRNLNSEKVAIKSFENIYKYKPTSATDWDIVRAIAYSGAKR